MRPERYGGWRCRHMRGRKDHEEAAGEGAHEWQGRRGRHRHAHGREGGRRIFEHGELRHVVLALLAEQPRHGYDIIRAIDQRTGGAYCPSPGVIYPTLQLLQDVGHAVPATGGETRNSYAITAEGRAFLELNRMLVGDLLARMDEIGRAQSGPSRVIVAAMDNLKSALRGRLEPWSVAEAHEVASAIDTAAERIRALRAGSTVQSQS